MQIAVSPVAEGTAGSGLDAVTTYASVIGSRVACHTSGLRYTPEGTYPDSRPDHRPLHDRIEVGRRRDWCRLQGTRRHLDRVVAVKVLPSDQRFLENGSRRPVQNLSYYLASP